ncbi:hypothetical protein [Idiomarina ramblicola]|uniref:Uncharacterized protein n=1 Tax=Idiomarina ramblicola TaxID=263724 RepID=A0A432Z1J6_9GAMM|nr:hypothetical protein [Idiomarina ramblicola]RUO71774.1 hypothetical protein CWI78_04460 [Idiomarina ramblicola]
MNQLNQTQNLQKLLTELKWANDELNELNSLKKYLPTNDDIAQQQQKLDKEQHDARIGVQSRAWSSSLCSLRLVAEKLNFKPTVEQMSLLDAEDSAEIEADAIRDKLKRTEKEKARINDELDEVNKKLEQCQNQIEAKKKQRDEQQKLLAANNRRTFYRKLAHAPGIVFAVITAILSIEYLIA